MKKTEFKKTFSVDFEKALKTVKKAGGDQY